MIQNKALLAIVAAVIIGAASYSIYHFTQPEDDKQPATNNTQSQNTSNESSNTGDQEVEGRLVDGFPGNKIPLYLGEVVNSRKSTSSSGRAEYNVRIQTSDDMSKVVDRTETSYLNDGWDITTRPSDSMFISHSNEYIVTVSFHPSGDGVLINYGISAK